MIPGIVASTPFVGVVLPTVTWSPADKSATISLSSGDLIATKTGASSYGGVRATHPVIGKKYFEVYISSVGAGPFMVVGVLNPAANLGVNIGADNAGWGYYQETGDKIHGGEQQSYGASFTGPGTVVGVAVDADSGSVEFFRNGESQGTAFTGMGGDLYPAVSLWRAGHVIGGRFRSSDFSYSPPLGFGPMGG